jgi:hypothetical protein
MDLRKPNNPTPDQPREPAKKARRFKIVRLEERVAPGGPGTTPISKCAQNCSPK